MNQTIHRLELEHYAKRRPPSEKLALVLFIIWFVPLATALVCLAVEIGLALR